MGAVLNVDSFNLGREFAVNENPVLFFELIIYKNLTCFYV